MENYRTQIFLGLAIKMLMQIFLFVGIHFVRLENNFKFYVKMFYFFQAKPDFIFICTIYYAIVYGINGIFLIKIFYTIIVAFPAKLFVILLGTTIFISISLFPMCYLFLLHLLRHEAKERSQKIKNSYFAPQIDIPMNQKLIV